MKKATQIKFIVYLISYLYIFLFSAIEIIAQKAKEKKIQEGVIIVGQDSTADFYGKDEGPLKKAIAEACSRGEGTIIIKEGTYAIRKPLALCSGLKLVGKSGAVLKLPKPELLTEETAKGKRTLTFEKAGKFRANTKIEILRPGIEKVTQIISAEIASINVNQITLQNPIDKNVPAKSRIGYGHNMVNIEGGEKNISIHNLTFDGGKISAIEMMGHAKRCAIWIEGDYTYEKGPKGPPVSKIAINNCDFRNCYGRGVAMYSVIHSKVTNCRFTNIDDEAVAINQIKIQFL